MTFWQKPYSRKVARIIVAVLVLGFAINSTNAYAGNLNSAENRIIEEMEKGFSYKGDTYFVVESYRSLLIEKLEEDDVDLTEEQADQIISYIYNNIDAAIEKGYLKKIEQEEKEEQEETKEKTKKGIDSKAKDYIVNQKVTKNVITLAKGQKYKLILPKAGKNKITWKNNGEKIIHINKKGILTANKCGNTRITAQYPKKTKKGVVVKKIRTQIKVRNYIVKMEVQPEESIQLQPEESAWIYTKVYPLKAKQRGVLFESDNPEIAVVDENGKVTGKKAGQAKIKIVSKGKDQKKRKLEACIYIFVKNESGILVIEEPLAQGETPYSEKNETEKNGTEKGEEEKPADSNQDKWLQACIDGLPKVDENTLVAGTILAKGEKEEAITLYFINKEYKGNLSLTFGETSFSMNMNPLQALKMLETMGYTGKNSSKTIQVERRLKENSRELEEWWKVTELTTGKCYQLKGMADDTIYYNKNGYGLVIVKGDTTNVVKIQ